jgi:hypothetical protein
MNPDDYDGWRVRVYDEPDGWFSDRRRLLMGRVIGDDKTSTIIGFGEEGEPLAHVHDTTATTEFRGFWLPAGLVAARGAAINPGPRRGELARVLDSIAIERGRVDRILGSLLS